MAERARLNQITITGPNITLADLQWLVQNAAHLASDSRVHLFGGQDDPRDPIPERLVLDGKIGTAVPVTAVARGTRPL